MSGPQTPVIVSTSSLWMWELERIFGTFAEAGFQQVELMITRDPRTQSPDLPARLAKKEGLGIVAIHAPMLVVTRGVWGPNFLPIIEKSTEMATRLSADVVIVHPPYVWELRYQAWLLGEMDKFSAEHQVAIAVENMFRLWIRGRPVRGHRWVSPSDLERFTQITLDTSHCGVDGYDILEALEKLGPQIAHIHLSDSRHDHRDNHLLPGSGVLPLAEFLGKVSQIGFRGAVCLELDMREKMADPSQAVSALKAARHFCEDHLG